MGIPLTVQIVSVVVMSLMLWSVERESASIDRSRDIASESLRMAKLIYDAEFELFSFLERMRQGVPSPPILMLRYKEKHKAIEVHLHQLWNLAKDRPKERPLVEKFVKKTKSLLRMMDQIKDRMDGQNLEGVFTLGMIMSQSHEYLPELSYIVEQLAIMGEAEEPQAKFVASLRQYIVIVLLSSVVINIVVVLILFIQFNRGTISRLGILMDNTRRLANHQKLNPELEGADEIGELDRVFHEAADALEAARQREIELMELKKQIMSMVSHDLRAPLMSLQISLDMLESNMLGELPEAAHQKVVQSEQSVDRLVRMINDLLDVEKLEAGMMEMDLRDLPLQVIVDRAIAAVDELAKKKGVDIVTNESELEVKGDGDRLIQVLVNFLSNAIKFSPENSKITLNTRLQGDFAELRVNDSGPGIPEEARLQVFERFRQIKGEKAKGGTGLGLAICKLIVEMHGGKIGVDAAEGGGASFWLTVPAVKETFDDDV